MKQRLPALNEQVAVIEELRAGTILGVDRQFGHTGAQTNLNRRSRDRHVGFGFEIGGLPGSLRRQSSLWLGPLGRLSEDLCAHTLASNCTQPLRQLRSALRVSIRFAKPKMAEN